MPKKLNKNHRYAMRLEDGMYRRLREISLTLHAPLPEMLCVGALLLFAQATTPGAYSSLKRNVFVDNATSQTRIPPNLAQMPAPAAADQEPDTAP